MVMIIRIDDVYDPRVSQYRDIRERDLVGRRGRFIAEGNVVLGHLLSASRFRPESILVLENRLAGIETLLSRCPADVPVYVTSRDVMDRVAGFPVHRGVLAIGLRGEDPDIAPLVKDSETPIVVCVGISNHDNIGSIFRNAAAFGAAAVLLDRTCCDPLYRKAVRVSVGAVLTVPFRIVERADIAWHMLSQHGYRQLALTPSASADLRSFAPQARTALYLGTEGSGLPAELIDRLTPVRIAMAPGFDSLNVAAASAVALHHLTDRLT